MTTNIYSKDLNTFEAQTNNYIFRKQEGLICLLLILHVYIGKE